MSNEPSAKECIAQFVVSIRQSGVFLPYDDYSIIDRWLNISPDVDRIVTVLSELLPPYFDAKRQKGFLPGLQGISKKVEKKLSSS
jgi:hypothetical protein